MTNLKAWLVRPSNEVTEVEIPEETLFNHVNKLINADGYTDMTKVKWQGKLSTMIVDDMGHPKQLPLNRLATEAYWANCIPGTTHTIVGSVVIFDGLLS